LVWSGAIQSKLVHSSLAKPHCAAAPVAQEVNTIFFPVSCVPVKRFAPDQPDQAITDITLKSLGRKGSVRQLTNLWPQPRQFRGRNTDQNTPSCQLSDRPFEELPLEPVGRLLHIKATLNIAGQAKAIFNVRGNPVTLTSKTIESGGEPTAVAGRIETLEMLVDVASIEGVRQRR
jgi:hypothetical protein